MREIQTRAAVLVKIPEYPERCRVHGFGFGLFDLLKRLLEIPMKPFAKERFIFLPCLVLNKFVLLKHVYKNNIYSVNRC